MSSRGWEIFAGIKRVVIFLLGVLVIVDSLLGGEDKLSQLIVGSVLVGILPVEDFLGFGSRVRNRDFRENRPNGR
jgi:hypothetical protein